MYYIYILRCQDLSLYTGITTNIHKRYIEHVTKNKRAAKYTKRHTVVCLEALWTCSTRQNASRLEHWIKRLNKEKKEKLISNQENMFYYLSDKIDITLFERIDQQVIVDFNCEMKEMYKD